MKPETVIKDLFFDFFFHDVERKYAIPFIRTDTEIFYLIRNLALCKNYPNTISFAQGTLKDYINTPIQKLLNNERIDDLSIDKHILHISYNWYASLQRLIVLENSVDHKTQLEILSISISDIFIISL